MQEYIFFENRKIAIWFLHFFFLPSVNKRDKVMKRKMSIVFVLFHDDCFAEQPKRPTYQLNISNIPYEKEDRKTEIKVGQFPLNVY